MRDQERKHVQMVQVCRRREGYTTFVPNTGSIEPTDNSPLEVIVRWVHTNLDRPPVVWEIMKGIWMDDPELTLIQQEVRQDLEREGSSHGTQVWQYLENASVIATGTRDEVLKMFKIYARML